MPREFRILSIDGGGIRGLIPAVILQAIEEQVKKPIAQCFDLIAGTSTGGILAVALTRADGRGEPKWSAKDLAALYESRGPTIFDRSIFHMIGSGFGLADEKYPRRGLEGELDHYLGDSRLKDALTEVLVTAYETEQRFPFFFKRRKARDQPEAWDFPIKSVAYATSAAPTYFEPLKLRTEDNSTYYSLIDGGVYANNPALCAYVEARKHHGASEIMMVSLGTGELTRRIPFDEVKDWGLRQWIWPHTPILNVVFDGVSDAVDYQLGELIEDESYFRFQPKLDDASDDMDDASADNLRALRLQATRLLAERDERGKLEQLCERLRH